ncbi:MAG: hypothetical protein IKN63_05935 [Bacilli bacterium]|nr:hypothetical protein [Bacilli bacterium]
MNNKNIDTIFYNSNHQLEKLNNYYYLNEGQCGVIYRKDNQVLKIYRLKCPYAYRINRQVFNILKELNLNNIVKLNDYYHFFKSSILSMLPVDAYIMEYIEPSKSLILDKSKDYILFIIKSLEETSLKLAQNKIVMYDSHYSNIIFTDNNAIIIDVDSYQYSYFKSVNSIYLHNKKEVLKMFKSKIINELKDKDLDIDRINDLLNFDLRKSSLVSNIKNLCDKDTLQDSLINKMK